MGEARDVSELDSTGRYRARGDITVHGVTRAFQDELSSTAPASPLAGWERFIHYGFMPNRLNYCGGDDNRTLFEYAVARTADGDVAGLLRRFTGALPYLQLIARANGIADPFDGRVVEAYWLGNELLDRVEVRELYDALLERFGKQLQGRTRDLVLGKAPAGARPHHSFHVFDVHSRVGDLGHNLSTLEHCRVSWGTVVAVAGGELVVDRVPLVLEAGKLALGAVVRERVLRQIDGRGFIEQAGAGDRVSIHWGWACEVLSERQLRNLERFTRHQLAIANQTI